MMSDFIPSIPIQSLGTTELYSLHFHLQSIIADLLELNQQVEETIILATALDDFIKLREHQADIIVRLEHITSHHLAKICEIVGQELDSLTLTEVGERLAKLEINWEADCSSSQEPTSQLVLSLQSNLRKLLVDLRLVSDTICQSSIGQPEDLANAHSPQQLLQLAQILEADIFSQCETLRMQTVILFRENCPHEAAQEDEWKVLATPLRVLCCTAVQDLDMCPYCNAVLTSNDRTFDGFYCESCRTKWIEET